MKLCNIKHCFQVMTMFEMSYKACPNIPGTALRKMKRKRSRRTEACAKCCAFRSNKINNFCNKVSGYDIDNILKQLRDPLRKDNSIDQLSTNKRTMDFKNPLT